MQKYNTVPMLGFYLLLLSLGFCKCDHIPKINHMGLTRQSLCLAHGKGAFPARGDLSSASCSNRSYTAVLSAAESHCVPKQATGISKFQSAVVLLSPCVLKSLLSLL